MLTNALTESIADAVKLFISISGHMALWCGLMKIAEKCGIVDFFIKLLQPVLNILFKNYKNDTECKNLISLNMISNFLGLGNAATPAGIKAMQRMNKLNQKNDKDESICLFLLINMSSIQLIPTTVAAIRSAQGSIAPFDILIPVWLTSLLSLLLSVILFKVLYGIINKK